MQRFAVIGLGRFGSRLANNLASAGQEVIAIDKNKRLIEEMRDRVTLAVALDATDERALRSQGVDQVDVAIVGIGDAFESATLITVILKQLGVPRIISRASAPTSAHIMKRIGADEIVTPEDESADRWAVNLTNPWFLSRFELDTGHSIVEINTPPSWVGKTLIELKLRHEYGVHVVAIKTPRRGENDEAQRWVLHLPMPDQPLDEHDMLVLIGSDDNLSRLPNHGSGAAV